MVWKVRADCTYTTAANATSRISAVQALLPSHPLAVPSDIAVGRFPGGITTQSSTRFTIAFDFDDSDSAAATDFASALHTALNASTKSTTNISVHLAKGM